MRYYVTIADTTFEVDVAADRTMVDGREVDATLIQVPGSPLRRLSVDGASHRVVAEPGESSGQWDLHLDGYQITADVVDERTRAIRALTGRANVAQGPKPIKAPMPGMIVRIEVQVGDRVQAGQGIVIIEAMKMENELKADAPGTVAKVLIAPGTAVEKGTVLIEFESGDSGEGRSERSGENARNVESRSEAGTDG
jgi:biotin carboxyl carrier protein